MNYSLAIIGLGYVGLPLALAFGKFFKTIGYDIDLRRINELKKGFDRNNESSHNNFVKSKFITFTNEKNKLKNANVYIVTVPTPVYKNKKPDCRLLINACKLIGKILKKNDIVIFESTVFPGMTEDICVPILSKTSGLFLNLDFYVGYSPERINPGDTKRNLKNIPKLVSSSNKNTLKIIYFLYSKIIKAKIHKVETIKIAEAAKIIENTQRDINIAFMNELAVLFDKLNIDTHKVIKAASTKWNFLKFYPGLVGGHCIGVDPYYLTHIAKLNQYKTKIILSGRKINDNMYKYIIKKLINQLQKKKFNNKIKILIMGYTFKENCSDIRNSQVVIINNSLSKDYIVNIFDPLVYNNYKNKIKNLIRKPKKNYYDVIILAVNHKVFLNMGINNILKFAKKKNIIYDIKNIFPNYNNSLKI